MAVSGVHQVGDMGNFAALNAVYCEFFPRTEPAARVCVETELGGLHCRVRLLLRRGELRRHLHVQSTSFWAMPTIGPCAPEFSLPLS